MDQSLSIEVAHEYQRPIFEVTMDSFIDTIHELVHLSKQIDWEPEESEFAE